MKLTQASFVSILCGMVICTTAMANCTDATFRKNYPTKCANFIGTETLAISTGITALGGALALLGSIANTDGGTQSQPGRISTMNYYSHVGGDIDDTQLAAVMNSAQYDRNFDQYNDIRLAYATARGYTGTGSTIAVMDTGADHYHGRAVMEIASGPIAPNATVESYQIAYNSVDFMPYKQIGAIIASAHNADIINNSWNATMGADAIHSRAQIAALTDSDFIQSVSDAAQRGAIFIWAAGNNAAVQSGALSALPRVMPELNGHFINVVAWDSATGALADYSNACGVTKDYCITAPGTDISVNKMTVSGTSFAAPVVSAAIAVLREAFPYMTAPEITELLFTTARDLGDPGVDETYGWGMLDLERATRPVGAPMVPLSDNMMVPLRSARVPSSIAHKMASANPEFTFFDSFGRAFTTDVKSNISGRNRGLGFDRLRGTGRTSISIDNVEFGFGNSEFLSSGGFLRADEKTTMTFIAANGAAHIGDFTFFQRTQIGKSSPRPTPESIITSFSDIYTASATIGLRHGDWEFAVSAPDTIFRGRINMHLPTGKRADGTIVFHDYDIDIATRPAMEYAISYKTFTAAFIDNPYGIDEFYVIAKTKLRF